MPSTSFEQTVTVAAPPERVWEGLQDPRTWEGVGPIDLVRDARHTGDDLDSFRFEASAAGRTLEGSARVTARDPGRSMTLGLDAGEVRAAARAGIDASGTGARLTVRLEVEAAGMLATLFWRRIHEALASGFEAGVHSLAERIEAREG